MKRALALILAIILVVSMAACSSSNDNAADGTQGNNNANTGGDTITKGGTMTYNISFDPFTLLPWGNSPGLEFEFYICEYLLKVNADGELEPWLAESIETNREEMSYTLKIRQGVKFHDGSDLNADVVAWNLNNYKANGALSSSYFSEFDNAEAVDDYTVVIHMNTWNNLFPQALSRDTYICSKQAYEEHGEEYLVEHPVGTGPFMMDSWEHNTGVTLKAFADYWGGAPYVDELYLPIYTTTQVAQAALQTEELDVLNLGPFPDFSIAQSMESNPDVTVYKSKIKSTAYTVVFNSNDENDPFSDVRVRQAVSYAIDSAAITQSATYGYGEVTDQWASVGTKYYADGLESAVYNIERAKELMKEAGYENGFSTTITLQQGTFETGAQIIAQELAELNISVEINVLPQASYVSAMTQWSGMLLHPMNMANGAATQYAAFFTSDNQSGFGTGSIARFDDIDNVIESALLAETDEEATELFKEAATLICQDHCLMKVITSVSGMVIANNYVKDAGFGDGYYYANTIEKAHLEK